MNWDKKKYSDETRLMLHAPKMVASFQRERERYSSDCHIRGVLLREKMSSRIGERDDPVL